MVSRQTDDRLALAAQNALSKIDAVLPAELRHQLRDNGFHVGQQQAQSVNLAVLRLAVREQRKVQIAYRDFDGTVTERIAWPISLGFIENKRYVASWCELRQDFRTFRIDRIAHVDVQAERYPGRRRDLASSGGHRSQTKAANSPALSRSRCCGDGHTR